MFSLIYATPFSKSDGDLSGGRVRLMRKSRIQKPSTSRQCTLRIMDLHVRWMHPMHIGRTPILEKTTAAAALHLISLIIRAALNCRGRVRLIGAFGGGWLSMLLVHEVGTRLISIMALFCCRVRSVKWIGRLLWRAPATLKPLYAEPTRDRLFYFSH